MEPNLFNVQGRTGSDKAQVKQSVVALSIIRNCHFASRFKAHSYIERVRTAVMMLKQSF